MVNTEVEVVRVKLEEEEAARGAVFYERNAQHAQARLGRPMDDIADAEVTVKGEKEFTVANTPAVREAIRVGRLVLVGKAKVKEAKIYATQAAVDLAAENEIDMSKVTPTGRQGTQITKGDVQRTVKQVEQGETDLLLPEADGDPEVEDPEVE